MKAFRVKSTALSIKSVNCTVERPNWGVTDLVTALIKPLPDDVTVTETKFSVIAKKDNKRMILSAWYLTDIEKVKVLMSNDPDAKRAWVFSVGFTVDGKFVTDVDPVANDKFVVTTDFANKNIDATFKMIREQLKTMTTALKPKVAQFFGVKERSAEKPAAPKVDETNAAIVAELRKHMPEDAKLSTKLPADQLAGIIDVNASKFIGIKYAANKLTVSMNHSPDETDRMYGSTYEEIKVEHIFKSVDDVKKFDFDKFFKDFSKREPRMLYQGSLGT